MKKFILSIFAIIGLSFVLCNKTYAVDDVVFNIDANSTFPVVICENRQACSDFTYIKFEPVPASAPTNTNNSYFSVPGLYGTRIPTFTTSLFDITSNYINGISLTSFSSYLSSLKITLTDSISSNCPEPTPPDPCVPDENSHYVQAVMDSFWNYHTAFAGSVVALIAIFLVYRLLKGRLR